MKIVTKHLATHYTPPMKYRRQIALVPALLLGWVVGLKGAPDTLRITPLPLPASVRAAITKNQVVAHVWCDPDWYTWCGSVVRGPDGQYHMFYSRWPRSTGLSGWLVFSEIGHAVAAVPQGPYRFKNLALPSRGEYDWNRLTAHNPDIVLVDGHWYLYHIGTYGEVWLARSDILGHPQQPADWAGNGEFARWTLAGYRTSRGRAERLYHSRGGESRGMPSARR